MEIDRVEVAEKLYNDGYSLRQIANILGCHFSTVMYWKNKNFQYINVKNIPNIENYLQDKKEVYSYILGLYLGDGYIDKIKKTYRLRIFLDSKYIKLINECVENLKILFPNNKINKTTRHVTLTIVYIYSNNLPSLFPQIGLGRKHNRKIELENWQKNLIIDRFLLKGFFHSDGSSYFILKRGHRHYNFKNYSEDILTIYKDCCDRLGIGYTLTKNTINHNRLFDTDKLFDLIGIKE